LLASFIGFFQKRRDLRQRIKADALSQEDLFYLRRFCQEHPTFAGHPFRFVRVEAGAGLV
jgi:hypothetical protein